MTLHSVLEKFSCLELMLTSEGNFYRCFRMVTLEVGRIARRYREGHDVDDGARL